MFESILNSIGFGNFVIIVLATIPFVYLIIVDLLFYQKHIRENEHVAFIPKHKFILGASFISLLTIGLSICIVAYYSTIPKIIYSNPSTGENWVSYNQPIEVKFNVPIKISSLDPSINPELKGHWIWEKFLFSDYTVKGKFYPTETYYPEQRIVIYIVGASRFLVSSENHELALNFFGPKAPEIISSSPKDGTENEQRETNISFTFNKNNYYLAQWEYQAEPSVDMDINDFYSDKLVLTPKTTLKADTNYKITLKRKPIKYDLATNKVIETKESDYTYTIKFKTLKEPFIQTFTPQGSGVHVDVAIQGKFTLAMNQKSVEDNFQIQPNTQGKFTWKDESTFIFTPSSPLPKETKYKVTIKKGVQSKDQGPTYKDLSFNFETVGAVKVAQYSPQMEIIGLVNRQQ